MLKLSAVSALLIALFPVLCYAQPSPTPPSLPDAARSISVRDFGAVGDGEADDTAAFERAIAQSREDGVPVHVPAGKYRITSTLELEAQALIGAETAAWVADAVTMPTLLPEVEQGPCIRLKAGGAVHGLLFDQNWKGEEPAPRPPTIELAGVGTRVSDIKIHNAWDGIAANGSSNVGRALITNCFLVNIHNVGVRILGTWDVSWISRVEVWSPSSKHFLESGIGFQIGKNDMLLMSDCFVFRASRAYHLTETIPGCEIKGVMWGSMTNCAADFCSKGVVVEGGHTVSLAGGTYWTHHGGLLVDGPNAQVRMSGLEMKANGDACVDIRRARAVAISGCQFRREMASFTAPAVRVTGGDAVAITGCVISSTSSALEISPDVANAAVTGNAVREKLAEPDPEENPAP